jgi:hypothetical protein
MPVYKDQGNKEYIHHAQCKICSHPRRTEIERIRLVDETPYTGIQQWMRDYDGNCASIRSLSNHFVHHMTPARALQVKHWAEAIRKERENLPEGTNKMEVDLHRLRYMDNIIVENMVLMKIISGQLQEQLATKIPKYYPKKNVTNGNTIAWLEVHAAKIDKGLIDTFRLTQDLTIKAMETKYKILGHDSLTQKADKELDIVNFFHQRIKEIDGVKNVDIEDDNEPNTDIIDFGEFEDDEDD